MEVQAQATAHNGRGNLLHFGRGKDKDGVSRRLFERLQKSVERGAGKLMHFVDDVDLVFAVDWRVTDVVADGAGVVYRVVACGVDLNDVKTGAGKQFFAAIAFPARRAVFGRKAVDRTRKDPCDCLRG